MFKYLELDSTYRNRNLWPEPAQFEVQVSQSGGKNQYNALDPVSLASPIKIWIPNNFNALGGNQITTFVESIYPVSATNSNQTFFVTATLGTLQKIDNYYSANVANNYGQSPFLINPVSRRIMFYKYLGTVPDPSIVGSFLDRAEIMVENSFGDSFSNGDKIIITDPTDFTDPVFPLIFVPNGRPGTNSYNSFILYNETKRESRKIFGYDSQTHLLRLDTLNNNTVPTWSLLDIYSIRISEPMFIGIIKDEISLSTCTITSGPRGLFGNVLSDCDNYYNNLFIRILYPNNTDLNIRQISKYCSEGDTKKFILCNCFDIIPTPGLQFEILQFSYDNYNPFSYNGSVVSQQEEVSYEISLLNLVLPNNTLAVGQGSRIAFYPYIYVELTNISSARSGLRNIIYSNNPNSTRVLFRCPVTDLSNPIITNFINFSSGMTQTVKFKPNDNLRFSVFLSNGEVYKTIVPEFYSPLPPNPQAQVSAIFALRRVSN